MHTLNDRTMARLELALEAACRSMPHGGDHDTRKQVAERLLDCALVDGKHRFDELERVARTALADITKQSA